MSIGFDVRRGWHSGQDQKKIGLPFDVDLLQDRSQLAAQRRHRGPSLRRDVAQRFARHELRREPRLSEGQSEIGREVFGLGGSRVRIDDDDEGHRIGIEAKIKVQRRDGQNVVVFAAKTIVVLRVMPADENAAARRFASGPVADTIAALSFAVSNTRAAPSAPFWTTRPSPRRTTRSASPFISTTRPCASTMITPVEKWSKARAATPDFHSSSRSRS